MAAAVFSEFGFFMQDNALELEKVAKSVRTRIVKMVSASKSSHVGTSLSEVEILVSLYFSFLKIDPKDPKMPLRDRFVLSKGHGCAGYYATLVERGFAPPQILDGFCRDNGTLWGHSTWKTIPGIEASTGSLGHGLSLGVGMAIAGKIDKKPYRVAVLLSDGECDEGSVWEAMLFAGHRHLDNLVAIVDYNKIQSFGRTKDVLDLEPFADKWRAARWAVTEANGHSIMELAAALSKVPFEKGKPSIIIAHTTKGKGVSFMQDSIDWHYKSPDAAQLAQALGEIDEKNIC